MGSASSDDSASGAAEAPPRSSDSAGPMEALVTSTDSRPGQGSRMAAAAPLLGTLVTKKELCLL